MSRLLLIRHAQASFDRADYDQLSELGRKQARALGDWLARIQRVDRVYVGPLKRHRQTAEAVYEELRLLGIAWPEPELLPGLDEHKGPQVMRALLPTLLETDERLVAWARELENSHRSRRAVHLQMFDHVMRRWAANELEDEHLELPTWAEFRRQVRHALEHILQQNNSGSTVVGFTSGGTISAAVGHALGMEQEEKVIGLNGLVYNSSLSEFLFSGERLSLKAFNAIPHLHRPELHTYV